MPMLVKNSYFVTKIRVFLVTDNVFWTDDIRSQTNTNATVKPLDHVLFLLLNPVSLTDCNYRPEYLPDGGV
jgi:hypothetical protein